VYGSVVRLSECLAALWAGITLESLSIFTEAVCSQTAVRTRHFDPCFLRVSEPK
jgi:hypothetical protein